MITKSSERSSMTRTGPDSWSRRKFLQGAGAGLALVTTAPRGIGCGPKTEGSGQRFLREHGFWEYTTPGAGGFEAYDYDDYMLALDDMVQAGMNSLLLQIKWVTTGYRSGLPYLDQLPGNRVIESDNELLRKVIAGARARKIKTWLSLVTNHFEPDKFGSIPHTVYPSKHGCPIPSGVYDPDAPRVVEASVEMFEEAVDLFPDVDGLELEMEYVADREPHRIPFYNEWAKANNRPLYDDPGCVSGRHWFDYQTASIIKVMKAVEKAVRDKGFRGDLAHINYVSRAMVTDSKTGIQYRIPDHVVNVEMMQSECPSWGSIDYAYHKGLPRSPDSRDWYPRSPDCLEDFYMDVAVGYPKRLGLTAYYLARGVMTYTWGGTDRQRLERSWEQDVADVLKHQPQGFWWFGAGSRSPGAHTSLPLLKQLGYPDDVAARRALLKIAAQLQAAMA
jgi:hypothetical protein